MQLEKHFCTALNILFSLLNLAFELPRYQLYSPYQNIMTGHLFDLLLRLQGKD